MELSSIRELPRRVSSASRSRVTGNPFRPFPQPSRDSFFVRQERMLDVLLAWGAGNVLGGLLVAAAQPGIPRAIGVQAVAWGLLNTALATGWQCAARRNAVAARSGVFGARAVHDEAQHFERVLALNSGLGAVYVATGTAIALRGRSVWAHGTGAGIIIQGSALLAYDLGLTVWTLLRPETRMNLDG